MIKRTDASSSMLQRVMRLYTQGAIQPIRPTRCFDASKFEEAFRSMQKGQSYGKLVLNLPASPSDLVAAPARGAISLLPDSTYLLVGGLGGLGRSVAVWMAEHGAKNLIFLSRSGAVAGDETEAFINELAALDCVGHIMPGDVTKIEDLRHVIAASRAPIAGVIQMAMVLRDMPFSQSTYEDWSAVLAPKVRGTSNLHEAFLQHDLDFFVLFSSISGIVGNPGQASYAAANTYLDAFVQFRHQAGLAASVLDVGAMGEVGYLENNPKVKDHLAAKFGYILQEEDLLDSLELAIKQSRPAGPAPSSECRGFHNPSQIGIGLRMSLPSTSPENKVIWKNDVRMSLGRVAESSTDSVAGGTHHLTLDPLKELLARVTDDASFSKDPECVTAMATCIGSTLFDFMMKPLDDLDIQIGLKSLGMDSLVAIELKNWCRQRVGVDVSVLEIMGSSSLALLGASVLEKVSGRLESKH
jgi:NADP-dependent 3-hydroxy acid dehydrogenase YdfG